MKVATIARITLRLYEDKRAVVTLEANVHGAELRMEEEYGPFDRVKDVLIGVASDLEVFIEDCMEAETRPVPAFQDTELPLYEK